MNPEIKELISLDVYRDGGSLSASFRDREGTMHVLRISIDNVASDSSQDLKFYKSASIESYIKSEYVSPVTGISSPKTEIKEKPVSWGDAKKLLEKLAPLVKGFQSEYLWVFDSMIIIVGNENHAIKYS